MDKFNLLQKDYPWIQGPLVVGAPMRLIARADMAVKVSKAGGIGFLAGGTDVSDLSLQFEKAQKLLQGTSLATINGTLPIGVGFINWGADLSTSVNCIRQYRPAAVWIFVPSSLASMIEWVEKTREASPQTRIWVQVGSVEEALVTVENVHPDVLVVQGTDEGGHGRVQGASIISLLPEVSDEIDVQFGNFKTPEEKAFAKPVLLAAGGIVEARSAAAAFTLGASGVILGTRLLASPEANITKGYQDEVLRASDGGQTTVRTKVYDTLRGTTWPETHNGRGIINKSYKDAMEGMSNDENARLYNEEMKRGDAGWGVENRMTTYAGSAVGLVKEVKATGEIIGEIREGVKDVLRKARDKL